MLDECKSNEETEMALIMRVGLRRAFAVLPNVLIAPSPPVFFSTSSGLPTAFVWFFLCLPSSVLLNSSTFRSFKKEETKRRREMTVTIRPPTRTTQIQRVMIVLRVK
ncbi:hypothetical protein BYT27DRAFT_6336724 [Phlegmacium glaucopus]|nr:hypothetical protein BYT27DRAFT_6336724 [Phlegmacium glaucopus]